MTSLSFLALWNCWELILLYWVWTYLYYSQEAPYPIKDGSSRSRAPLFLADLTSNLQEWHKREAAATREESDTETTTSPNSKCKKSSQEQS